MKKMFILIIDTPPTDYEFIKNLIENNQEKIWEGVSIKFIHRDLVYESEEEVVTAPRLLERVSELGEEIESIDYIIWHPGRLNEDQEYSALLKDYPERAPKIIFVSKFGKWKEALNCRTLIYSKIECMLTETPKEVTSEEIWEKPLSKIVEELYVRQIKILKPLQKEKREKVDNLVKSILLAPFVIELRGARELYEEINEGERTKKGLEILKNYCKEALNSIEKIGWLKEKLKSKENELEKIKKELQDIGEKVDKLNKIYE